MTDRRTDGGDCNIPDAFLKKRGDKNIIWIGRVCLYHISMLGERSGSVADCLTRD